MAQKNQRREMESANNEKEENYLKQFLAFIKNINIQLLI